MNRDSDLTDAVFLFVEPCSLEVQHSQGTCELKQLREIKQFAPSQL